MCKSISKCRKGCINLSLKSLSILYDTTFLSTVLDAVRFEACILGGCDMRGASMREAALENCDLDGTNLQNSSLGETSFRSSSLVRTDFSGARMERVILIEVNAELASFSRARLNGA